MFQIVPSYVTVLKSLFYYTTFPRTYHSKFSKSPCKSEKFYRSVGSRALQIKYFTLYTSDVNDYFYRMNIMFLLTDWNYVIVSKPITSYHNFIHV